MNGIVLVDARKRKRQPITLHLLGSFRSLFLNSVWNAGFPTAHQFMKSECIMKQSTRSQNERTIVLSLQRCDAHQNAMYIYTVVVISTRLPHKTLSSIIIQYLSGRTEKKTYLNSSSMDNIQLTLVSIRWLFFLPLPPPPLLLLPHILLFIDSVITNVYYQNHYATSLLGNL